MGLAFCISFFFFFLSFLLFTFERERERESKGERQRRRVRERIPSRFHTISTESSAGLEPTNHEVTTRAETQSRTLNQLSHPGALCISNKLPVMLLAHVLYFEQKDPEKADTGFPGSHQMVRLHS